MSKRDDDNRNTANSGGFGGAEVGVAMARDQAAATDALREGMAGFAQKAKDNISNEKGLKGFLFEHIEATKLNQTAARSGSRARAQLTSAKKGGGHDVADIKLRSHTGNEKLVQLKASDDAAKLAREAVNPKYEGLEIQVPHDKRDEVNRILAKRGASKRVVGELKHGGVASGGTTTSELDWATKNPKLYRLAGEARQVGFEALETGASAALGGAVIGGALSTITNGAAYMSGETDGRTAAKAIAKDTTTSSARAGGAGALLAVIRSTGERAGVQSLAKTNVAAAVASGLIEVGATVYAFGKDEITAEEAAERIGETGCSTASGLYVGAAAGTIFGPVGAVVGSVVGYMAMGWVYQSSLAVLTRARLTEDEAARIVAICAEATRAMEERREQFNSHLSAWLDQRDRAFEDCFAAVDKALASDEPDDTVLELARLVGMTGKVLRFRDFDHFDQFMTDSEEPLVL